jgi:hypothetical protein
MEETIAPFLEETHLNILLLLKQKNYTKRLIFLRI